MSPCEATHSILQSLLQPCCHSRILMFRSINSLTMKQDLGNSSGVIPCRYVVRLFQNFDASRRRGASFLFKECLRPFRTRFLRIASFNLNSDHRKSVSLSLSSFAMTSLFAFLLCLGSCVFVVNAVRCKESYTLGQLVVDDAEVEQEIEDPFAALAKQLGLPPPAPAKSLEELLGIKKPDEVEKEEKKADCAPARASDCEGMIIII